MVEQVNLDAVEQDTTQPTDETQKQTELSVVGIGASAGGLEALEKFFSHMPADTGVSFVVVQHLSPDYKSLMAELLSKHTVMAVHTTEDGMSVEPDNIYLIPRKKNMTIFHRKLYLTDRETEQGLNLPIDIFLNSLAEDLGEKAIALILSGTGSDGTRGIRSIKEAGGMVMAQDEQSARFDGMPRSAISTHLVDYVLAPEEMPDAIINYIKHPRLALNAIKKANTISDEDTLSKIFSLLRSRTGVDFSLYKKNTMVRRVERRMTVNQIEHLGNYLSYLYRSPAELDTLFKEFLIGVTRFFRDSEAFDFLQDKVLSTILDKKEPGDQIRVWVAACSTGEEAYSLAILLREVMEQRGMFFDVKIFATDLDTAALEFSSRGVYPESIAADVSPRRLKHYFIKREDKYEIQRSIREMVIFARQNLAKDPPFSKLDLVSCRNVLIYLQPILQKRVTSIFQFALRPEGFLFLGTSETVTDNADAFRIFHNKWRIYQYRGGFKASLIERPDVGLPADTAVPGNPLPSSVAETRKNSYPDEDVLGKLVEKILPPSLIIDENYSLLHAFGDVRPYLEAPVGYRVSLNILKMVHQDLATVLNMVLHQALKKESKETIVYKNVLLEFDDENHRINLKAKPFQVDDNKTKKVLVIFEQPALDEQEQSKDVADFDVNDNAQQRINDLEKELKYSRETLQSTIEELETSNEELQATNEELLAANEELQSTNEELQSVNEELITVNAEYQAKISELTELNNDMNNLLTSTDIGTVFLDGDLRIRKFTPAMQRDINLIEIDVGRPLSHISHNILNHDLVTDAEEVLKTLTPVEYEVKNSQNRWYTMKIRPYRTTDNVIKGVVMVFVDITALKDTNKKLEQEIQEREHAEELLHLSLDTLSAHIAILNEEGTIITTNQAWKQFGEANDYQGDDFGIGKNYLEVCDTASGEDATEASSVADGIRAIIRGKRKEFVLDYPCHGPNDERWFTVQVKRFESHNVSYVVVAHENITRRVVLSQALELCQSKLEALGEELPEKMVAKIKRLSTLG